LLGEDSWLAVCHSASTLAGYCAAVRFELPGRGRVAWVTQLVVSTTFRRERVATNLLYGVWQFTDCYAWGLATANPFAVRALETATRRPCLLSEIRRRGPEVITHLADRVTYIPGALRTDNNGRVAPRVDSQFFVDHSGLADMRKAAIRDGRRWALGNLGEGEEWFACTFGSQAPTALDQVRLEELLQGSDGIWMQAYEGMSLDTEHRWHAYAESEIEFCVAATGLRTGAHVLDVGCGDGRHSAALAGHGFETTAVDISERLVNQGMAVSGDLGITWEVRDARAGLPDGPFDAVLCLYDVLGSSANAEDDRRVMANIAAALAPRGWLVLSVMNTEAVLHRLAPTARPGDVDSFVRALEELAPSPTMESSGAIFDPTLLVYYNGVYYRKEQFEGAHGRLPTELVVRDKRYDADELRDLLVRSGFDVVCVQPSRLGGWADGPLERTDERAKELVAVARLPATEGSR
jgi:2-polyprenyl-3-methyl-5-hydroxy-6-metoxy-1,4-benzoquinol methylase